MDRYVQKESLSLARLQLPKTLPLVCAIFFLFSKMPRKVSLGLRAHVFHLCAFRMEMSLNEIFCLHFRERVTRKEPGMQYKEDQGGRYKVGAVCSWDAHSSGFHGLNRCLQGIFVRQSAQMSRTFQGRVPRSFLPAG